MCRRVNCPSCGKPTFAGCGRHVEQVLGSVPPSQRCKCRAQSATSSAEGAPGGAAGWLRGLLGRK